MDKTTPAAADDRERATTFVRDLMKRYGAYHNHKETMGYAGITLYIAAFGTALVAKEWPPAWGPASKAVTILGITGAWLVVLTFVKWQLLRRRWAAIRIAGTERLLAKWVREQPSVQDLSTWTKQAKQSPPVWMRIVDYIWPLHKAVVAVDVTQEVYPRALVEAWRDQAAERGTAALIHERLVLITGWVLYVALAIRTVITKP